MLKPYDENDQSFYVTTFLVYLSVSLSIIYLQLQKTFQLYDHLEVLLN